MSKPFLLRASWQLHGEEPFGFPVSLAVDQCRLKMCILLGMHALLGPFNDACSSCNCCGVQIIKEVATILQLTSKPSALALAGRANSTQFPVEIGGKAGSKSGHL